VNRVPRRRRRLGRPQRHRQHVSAAFGRGPRMEVEEFTDLDYEPEPEQEQRELLDNRDYLAIWIRVGLPFTIELFGAGERRFRVRAHFPEQAASR
jgi:hypothetical protein